LSLSQKDFICFGNSALVYCIALPFVTSIKMFEAIHQKLIGEVKTVKMPIIAPISIDKIRVVDEAAHLFG
jgi:hypothetical protein